MKTERTYPWTRQDQEKFCVDHYQVDGYLHCEFCCFSAFCGMNDSGICEYCSFFTPYEAPKLPWEGEEVSE